MVDHRRRVGARSSGLRLAVHPDGIVADYVTTNELHAGHLGAPSPASLPYSAAPFPTPSKVSLLAETRTWEGARVGPVARCYRRSASGRSDLPAISGIGPHQPAPICCCSPRPRTEDPPRRTRTTSHSKLTAPGSVAGPCDGLPAARVDGDGRVRLHVDIDCPSQAHRPSQHPRG
jgi:hypothetical protein